MTWLALAILIYAFVSAPKQSPTTTPEEAPTASQPTITFKPKDGKESVVESPINSLLGTLQKTETGQAFVETLITRGIKEKYGTENISEIIAQHAQNIFSTDTLKGNGNTAHCGATVSFTYRLFVDGSRLVEERTEPLTIILGQKQVIPGLEIALVGMKENGQRRTHIPANLAFDAPGFTNDLIMTGKVVTYDITLQEVKGSSIETYIPNNIYENNAGKGKPLECGDPADLIITARTQSGHPIKSQHSISVIAGAHNDVAAIEHNIIGMQPGGVRTLIFDYIVIADFLSPFIGDKQFSPNEPITLEIRTSE